MHDFIQSFDNRVIAWVQSWPAWLYQPMLIVTTVGQPLTVIIFSVGLLIWSVWQRHDRLAISSMVILGTIVVTSMLKLLLRRTRPETEYAANLMFQSFSFPSGHASAATVGFGFMAYAAYSLIPGVWGVVLSVLFAAFGLMVCVSRVYLGAHYPSDVLGGIVIGLIGLAIIVFVVRPFA